MDGWKIIVGKLLVVKTVNSHLLLLVFYLLFLSPYAPSVVALVELLCHILFCVQNISFFFTGLEYKNNICFFKEDFLPPKKRKKTIQKPQVFMAGVQQPCTVHQFHTMKVKCPDEVTFQQNTFSE